MAKLSRAAYDERKKSPTFNQPFGLFCRGFNYDNLFGMLSNFPSERLIELFNIDRSRFDVPEQAREPIERSDRKWSNREEMYRALMSDGTLHSDIDTEEAIELLHGYYDIRNERNQVNHANSGATKDIGALKEMIDVYLERLERIGQ